MAGHIKDEAWSAHAVFSAEVARILVMRYLDKKLARL
jgi:hypothetical protein